MQVCRKTEATKVTLHFVGDRWASSNEAVQFQIVLNASGAIDLIYGAGHAGNGTSATVGLESSNAGLFNLVAFNQNLIAPKQIETALGYGIHHAFTSDYRTVSTALNSGVPLALVNHSELASQFNSFTRQLLGQREEENEPEKRRAFLGLL